jgi:small subunit ribosomal protein S8
MSLNSVLADALARIWNAQKAKHSFVITASSGLIKSVLRVLKQEGYISGFEEFEKKKGIKFVKIDLRYHNGEGAIIGVKMLSKPGCRLYKPVEKLEKPRNGLGTLILSTSQGVMADHEALERNVGGEVLCMFV